jgi:hypothetical protein
MIAAASNHSILEVYLIPVSATTYELYCETPDDGTSIGSSGTSGLYVRFLEMVEQSQESCRPKKLVTMSQNPETPQSWLVRVRNWMISLVAEAVLDWRLLWRLRNRTTIMLLYPADLNDSSALEIVRSNLKSDVDRHRMWLIVDGILAGIFGPLLFFVPGPNLIAYYFVFRFVGHGLAWRGAKNGLDKVAWRLQQSSALVNLRRIMSLDPDKCMSNVRDIENELKLEHLSTFIERIIFRERRSVKDA